MKNYSKLKEKWMERNNIKQKLEMDLLILLSVKRMEEIDIRLKDLLVNSNT